MSNELTGGTDARRVLRHDSECGRAEEVVAYLYGETNDAEAASFAQHLVACASCRDEVVAFGAVRGRIGEWRAEAARLAPSPAAGGEVATAPAASASAPPPRRRSARAALREFFALAPRWMQAGTATAALAVCVLAALAFVRAEVRWDESGIALGTGGRGASVNTTEGTIPSGPTRAEVNSLVSDHAREVDALRRQLQQKEASLAAAQEKLSAATARPQVMTASGGPRQVRPRSHRGPSSRTTDPYLAGTNEDDLPRLYDLLRDVN